MTEPSTNKFFDRGRYVYTGDSFSVRMKLIGREIVSVDYTGHATSRNLEAGVYGTGWRFIVLSIPQTVEETELRQIVADLEIAFKAMGFGYEINRKLDVEIIPEREREDAISELRQMGLAAEVLGDGRVRVSKLPSSPQKSMEEIRQETLRMNSLLMTVAGKRRKYEVLAKCEVPQ